MNIIKLAKIFNRFSCRHLENVVAQLSGRHSDYGCQELIQKIDMAYKLAQLADLFGQREVTPEHVNSARQLCWARAAQQQLSIMAQPNFFEKMQLITEARSLLIGVLNNQHIDGSSAFYETDNLLTQYYEIIDRLQISLVRTGLVGNSNNETEIMNTMARLGLYRKDFPSSREFYELIEDIGSWLGSTIEKKKEELKNYASPRPK